MTKSPGTNSPRVVDEEAAVGVAVVGDAEVGALRTGLLDDERAVLLEQRIRLVVRERPVRLEVARDDVELGEALEHRRKHRSRHAVRRVDHDLQRPKRTLVDEREHLVDEAAPDVLSANLAALLDRAEAGLGPSPHVVETRVAAHGKRALADDLHARVLLRVVRGGHAHAAVEPELADRVVDHLGPDHSQVEHVGTAVCRALDQRLRHRRRGEAHVPADGDRARLELLDERPADAVGAVLVELRRVDPADVVGLEHLGVEHEAMLASVPLTRP